MTVLAGLRAKAERKTLVICEDLAEPLAFSTVFSTVVEILGKEPKRLRGIASNRLREFGTVTQDASLGFFDSVKP